jgi:disulfide bond formation protein DsbB
VSNKKIFNKKNWFTLLELIIVVAVVWILMLATTVYIAWSNEKRQIIEAQWCSSTLAWEITNYVFYALTSRNLRFSENHIETPDTYIIQLTWDNSCQNRQNFCDEIVFSYMKQDDTNIYNYSSIKSWKNCRWNKCDLKFYWSWWDIKYIWMNKWFLPTSITDRKVFYLLTNSNDKLLLWEIIIALCLNSDCTEPKEIWKWVADARSQTVSLKYCKYYEMENWNLCKTREDCRLYDSNDTSVCLEY